MIKPKDAVIIYLDESSNFKSSNIYFIDENPNEVYYIKQVDFSQYTLIVELFDNHYIASIEIVINKQSNTYTANKTTSKVKEIHYTISSRNEILNIDMTIEIYTLLPEIVFSTVVKSFQFIIYDEDYNK